MTSSTTNKRALLDALDVRLDKLYKTENDQHDKAVCRSLFEQYLDEKPGTIDWNAWKHLDSKHQIEYADLPEVSADEAQSVLSRIAVVRLNGGLGTTMGCQYPKSLITLRDGRSFLDFAIIQIEKFNEIHGSQVPLYLMNSFNTDEVIAAELKKMGKEWVKQFKQSRCPRIYADTEMPVPEHAGDRLEDGWYPPGHGNIFQSLAHSGILDDLISQGRDICFVSNIDNTGACIDLHIAKAMASGRADYIMEVTNKTEADKKGGSLIEIDGHIMHLEIPQVPADKVDEFCSLDTFKIFNTNNIWVNLKAVKAQLSSMKMEIIANKKKLKDGRQVIQLETSIGGAIRNFSNALSVRVGRHRFLPVKKTQDLLPLMSNAYEMGEDFVLKLNRRRLQKYPDAPIVELSSEFDAVDCFLKRFVNVPDLLEAQKLTVRGPVTFGGKVFVKGNVVIQTDADQPLTIPNDTIPDSLEDKTY